MKLSKNIRDVKFTEPAPHILQMEVYVDDISHVAEVRDVVMKNLKETKVIGMLDKIQFIDEVDIKQNT